MQLEWGTSSHHFLFQAISAFQMALLAVIGRSKVAVLYCLYSDLSSVLSLKCQDNSMTLDSSS